MQLAAGDAPADAAPARTGAGRSFGRLVVAALALPGLVPTASRAEEPPERATLALRLMHYQDEQAVRERFPGYTGNEPGRFERIGSRSPSLHLVLPFQARWSLEAGLTGDDVSGATPRAYSDISSATSPARGEGMSDRRVAGDLKVTRYFDDSAWGLGLAHSSERDYVSTALSSEARWSSADRNTTVNLGLGLAHDRLDAVNGVAPGSRRRSLELTAGVTRALSPVDLAQASLSLTRGRGLYSDPYKQVDERPRRRDQAALLLRWNHHVEALQASWRNSYRYYRDSWGIHAHTLETAWVQPLGAAWSLTPSLRLHSQGSARFYADPSPLPFYPDAPGSPRPYSTDARLSAFGALTWGLKLEARLDADWSADLQFERYRQHSGWRILGEGSPGIDDLHARIVQVGLRRSF